MAKTHFYGQFTHPMAEGKLKYKDMRHNDMNMQLKEDWNPIAKSA